MQVLWKPAFQVAIVGSALMFGGASAQAEDGAAVCLQQFSCEWHGACRLPCLDAAPASQETEIAAPVSAARPVDRVPRSVAVAHSATQKLVRRMPKPKTVIDPATREMASTATETPAAPRVDLEASVSPTEAFVGSHQVGPSEKLGALAYDSKSLPTKAPGDPFGSLR